MANRMCAAVMTPQKAEEILLSRNIEGSFILRNSTSGGLYSLSVLTKMYNHPQVIHYPINQNHQGQFYMSGAQFYCSVQELINFHRQHKGGLATRLTCTPCCKPMQPNVNHSKGKWEIHANELQFFEKLGEGSFGVVRRGKWMGMDVAIKTMKRGAMSEDEFLTEARFMKNLQHPNVVQLYGVCSTCRPISIVTEYLKNGSLLDHLIHNKSSLCGNKTRLLEICQQVCKGMAYLEKNCFIHRDLAARNCLVSADNVVKVADFGLSRYSPHTFHFTHGKGIYAFRWAPPEVLTQKAFSTKSDVWAFGVLMWEIFSCGMTPYGNANQHAVVELVKSGQTLSQPKGCPNEVYAVMKSCWLFKPESRPTFQTLKKISEEALKE